MATVEDVDISGVLYKAWAHLTTGTDAPVNDADDYLAAKIGSTWSTFTTLKKQQCIVTAARMLSTAVIYSGTVTVAGQPLAWPRDNATNSCTGVAVTSGTTPDDIAFAQYELAQILGDDPSVAASSGTGSNVKRVKAGSAEVEFFTQTIGSAEETRLPTVVNDLAGCFVDGTATLGGSYGTGTTQSDPGYCKDEYDRTEGYP